MTNTFVSYSRKDTDFARRMVDALRSQQLDAWVDWEGIPPTVDWMEQIQKGIAEADTFLFLLSPDSAASKVCGDELEYAARNNKRIIPIVVRDVKPDDAPLQTRHLNWIFFRDGKEDFDTALQKLITAIQTDYAWVQAHRRLQVKALEWEKHNKESGYLLRGADLADAEAQHAMNTSKEPHPTDLQREYVFASRKAVDRQRRTLTIASVVVAIALLGLGIFASIQAVEATTQAGIARENEQEALAQKAEADKQRSEAETQRNEAEVQRSEAERQREIAVEKALLARAGELSAQSVVLRDKNFQLSLLLGLESNQLVDNDETRGALLDNAQAHPQLLRYLGNISNINTSTTSSISLSADGKVMAIGTNPVLLWDVANNEAIGEPISVDQISTIALSSDGKVLATGSYDGSVALWDATTQQKIHHLQESYSRYDYQTYVAFSPDGKILASSRGEYGNNNDIKLWDVSTGTQIGVSLSPQSTAGEAAFSPDGALLAVADGNNVHLYDAKSGASLGVLNGNVYAVTNVAISPDGKTLAAGSYDHTIVLWDLTTKQQLGRWSTGQTDTIRDAITDLAFSPDGTIVASANNGGAVFLWNAQTHLPIGAALTDVAAAEVHGLAFAPDGKSIFSTNRNGSVMEWAVNRRLSSARLLSGHTAFVTAVAFSPDGQTLASGGYDRSIVLWDVESESAIGEPLNTPTSVRALAFSPDGKTLAASGCTEEFNCAPGLIWLWDVASREQTAEINTGLDSYPAFLTFAADGKTLLSHTYAAEGMDALLWNLDSGTSIGQPMKGVYAFSPDGSRLATVSEDGSAITFVETATGNDLDQQLPGPDGVSLSGVAFSPDGKIVASTFGSSHIVLWDAETGELLHQIFAGANNVMRVTFSPDGKMIASLGLQAPLLFNVESGGQIGEPFTGHTSYVNSIAFSPEGALLASASNDQSVILWDLQQQTWIENACQRAGRNLTQAEWNYYFTGEEYHLTCEQWPAGQ